MVRDMVKDMVIQFLESATHIDLLAKGYFSDSNCAYLVSCDIGTRMLFETNTHQPFDLETVKYLIAKDWVKVTSVKFFEA